MRYITMVKRFDRTHTCPFCHEKPEHIIEESKHFMILPARAQYVKHHILIVPKRHVNVLATLTRAEHTELYKLVDKRARKLHTKHKDVNLLLRDGLVSDLKISKSINHLHFHLLPDIGVHIQSDKASEDRIRLEDNAYERVTESYRKTFLS